MTSRTQRRWTYAHGPRVDAALPVGLTVPAALLLGWLALVLALLTGCAHTPLTGLAVERSVREAQARGWQRVGDVLVPPDVVVPDVAVGADVNTVLAARIALEELARTRGRSEYEVALTVRPWLVRLAQFGDGALITGAAAALGWAVDRVIDGGGGSRDWTHYEVRADRGAVVQIGNRDGSGGVGGGNVTEAP